MQTQLVLGNSMLDMQSRSNETPRQSKLLINIKTKENLCEKWFWVLFNWVKIGQSVVCYRSQVQNNFDDAENVLKPFFLFVILQRSSRSSSETLKKLIDSFDSRQRWRDDHIWEWVIYSSLHFLEVDEMNKKVFMAHETRNSNMTWKGWCKLLCFPHLA